MEYDFKKIEKKWQREWEKGKVFEVKENEKKKKYYVLEMFPYPSASGLHMGHALNYAIGDVYARFKRMKGFNVLYPMGFDALGLPAENAAIKEGAHPRPFTEKAIKNYIRQMKEIGLSYDWSKTVSTLDSEYYRWNQFFFLKFFENNLVYRKKAPVNWCPKCNTVLANEQVHNGRCWRHEDTDVEIKHLEQWFIKTTKYSDELLELVDNLGWPERIKLMQKNWIGKSYGTEINFKINNENWSVFTTRPDTIYGVTFMVVSAQHSRLMELVSDKQKKEVESFLRKLKSVSEKELELMEKEGVFTGSYAINPLTNEKVPVYAGNFVVADYGSGIVMAVPAHDQRDFEFAKKYNLPIKQVIKGGDIKKEAYNDEGILINSDKFNGLKNKEAIEKITLYLSQKKLGKKAVNYKFKDWLISRQRYWGTPIPIIYCDKCGIVPVPEKDLPIKLPEKIKFGKGNPLETDSKFVNVKCPKCKMKARRETDTMDTFFDSSWHYLRYCDNKNKKSPFDKKKIKYWMPVDQYIGGAEHACMHLIYARFFTKALRDLGFLDFDEPFLKLFNQGMLHGGDGEKMSKSKGNVINPDEVSKKYGMDTARIFLLSLASPEKDRDWSDEGINGNLKFMNKVCSYFESVKIVKSSNRKIESKINKAIKSATLNVENFKYNLAIINIREMFESMPSEINKNTLEIFLKLLHPFCPHITEELWHKIGNKTFISLEKWPVADESKIDELLEKQEQAVEKLAEDINHIVNLVKEKQNKIVTKSFIYVLPTEMNNYKESLDLIKKKTNTEVTIFAVNDKSKHDPENKSAKVKPGRPGIYLE
ncbi:MAG: leucine--tRNA ligase [Nanoarchaeota archaeon]